MAYTFDQIFAADPANPENVAGGASVLIFAPGDTTMTPLSITTPDGAPLANPVQTNANGFGSAFAHATLDRVAWAGGGFTGFFTSYEGMKAVAVEAAQGASDSAAEAAASAALVGAPADDAVAAALSSTDTASRAAAEAVVSGNLTVAGKVEKTTLASASDPLAYLNSISLLCEFPVREGAETSWPQGFAINKADNEIYVSNSSSDASSLRIDVRDLTTGVRKSSCPAITVTTPTWSEGLPWFKNASGELCFIVRTTAETGEDSTYSIYNYATRTLGSPIAIKGPFKADVNGDTFVTSTAYGHSATKFFIYTWASIKAGTPSLVATVPLENATQDPGKTQAVAVVGAHLYVLSGDQASNPGILVYDFTGRLVAVRDYAKADFQKAVNVLKPGYLTNDSFIYECEGATNLDGKLVTGQIVNNNPAVTADGKFLVLQHNRVDGSHIKSRPLVGYVRDTGWIPLTLINSFVAAYGPTPSVRRIGSEVILRGHVTKAAATNYEACATLPAGFWPKKTETFAGTANTTVLLNTRVSDANGAVEMYSSASTTVWRSLSGIRFFLD